MTQQVDKQGQATGGSRPDDGQHFDFSAEDTSPTHTPCTPKIFFSGNRDDDQRAQQPTIRIVAREHPLYRMTPEWLLAMKELMNANLVVPILALAVFVTSVVLLYGGQIDQTHFLGAVTACLTAVAVHKKKT